MPTASTAKLIIPPLPQNNKNRAFARFFAQIAIYRANAHLPVGRLALKPPGAARRKNAFAL
jgi:hypothetical protein